MTLWFAWMFWHLIVNIFFLSVLFLKSIQSFKSWIHLNALVLMLTGISSWNTCGQQVVVKWSYGVSCSPAGLPCSWSALFHHQCSQKGILAGCPPSGSFMSVPFKTVVSTNPVPGFPLKEQELYGWMGTQSSSLPPCSPTRRALLCHMGSENSNHPSSDGLPTPNKLCFPLNILSHLWHDAHAVLHS